MLPFLQVLWTSTVFRTLQWDVKITCELLRGTVVLVIVGFRSVVQHRHDVRIVVLVVIVERIEEDAQPVPLVRAAKDGALEALGGGEPKS